MVFCWLGGTVKADGGDGMVAVELWAAGAYLLNQYVLDSSMFERVGSLGAGR
jgi:hypothetical protein